MYLCNNKNCNLGSIRAIQIALDKESKPNKP